MSQTSQSHISLLSNGSQPEGIAPLVFDAPSLEKQGKPVGEFNRAKMLEIEIEIENLDATPAAGDFLDIWIQHSNNGTTWDDLIALPSILATSMVGGAAGKKVIKMYVNSYLDPGNGVDIHTVTDASLAGDTIRNVPIGAMLMVKAKSTGATIDMVINRCEASYKE